MDDNDRIYINERLPLSSGYFQKGIIQKKITTKIDIIL
jgi:hypothetical protein